MFAVQNVLVRIFIVLGMGAAVVTILYFTPVPDKVFLNCNRPCQDFDWPMICRVKLTLENYKTLQKYQWHSNNCSLEDDIPTTIIAVNRQVPGPTISVCENDILVVDVINKIPGQSVTMHWRGQPQVEAPMMDGVPMVTQCPISSYTTFQYKFRASRPGTHMWHAHAGAKFSDGIFGALIVNQPEKLNPFKDLYDAEEVLAISERNVDLDASRRLLINGKTEPEENVFQVDWGKRYRFRAMYSGGAASCPVTVSIDKHPLTILSLDGYPINPQQVSSVSFSKGERVDFIVTANQASNSYLLRVVSECAHNAVKIEGVVKYTEVAHEVLHRYYPKNRPTTLTLETAACESTVDRACVSGIQSMDSIPSELVQKVDETIYLGFDYMIVNDLNGTQLEKPPQKVYRMNNITFTYPSSPLLTQKEDVNKASICSSKKKPSQCNDMEICECVHIEQITLGSAVELIFADLGNDAQEAVFHLHGYQFYIVGSKQFKKRPNLDHLKKLNNQGLLLKRNFAKPVIKDTVRVPKNGVVAVRFLANNPGYWMLRDEHSEEWSRGMDVVLQVGGSCDMISKPNNFPTCGSWTGPDFFLI
ncbi:hypothetical protein RI129_005623 [Pyrocoelia pectoralis]|uniref:Laccase n=1 Tax=Pyrocoelia pectoralis TaxID=417401 RepID=A0AAN7VCJ8_9COLE